MAYQPKSYRKFLATSVAAAMVATVAAPLAGAEAADNKFTDVPAGAWYAEAVNELAAAGIIGGVSADKFNPTGEVTREQAAAFFSKAFGLDEAAAADNSFPDVPAGHWAEGAINAVAEKGWFVGTDGKFNPKDDFTREMFLSVLLRALEIEEKEDAPHAFTDVSEGHWAVKAINTAAELGYAAGNNGKFLLGAATRADIAGFFYKENVREQLPAWVAYDVKELEVVSVSAINATTARVTFNTPVHEDVDFTNFTVNGGLTVVKATLSSDKKSVEVEVNNSFTRNQEYTLTASGLKNTDGLQAPDLTGKFQWSVEDGVTVALKQSSLNLNGKTGLTVKDQDNKDVTGATVVLTSSNSNIVSVTVGTTSIANAELTAVAEGAADITAKVTLADGTILTNTFQVTVAKVAENVTSQGFTLVSNLADAPVNTVAYNNGAKTTHLFNDDAAGKKVAMFREVNKDPEVAHVSFTGATVRSLNPVVATASVIGSELTVVPNANQTGNASFEVTFTDNTKRTFTVEVRAARKLQDISLNATSVKLSDEDYDASTNNFIEGVNVQTITVTSRDQYNGAFAFGSEGKVTVTTNTEGLQVVDTSGTALTDNELSMVGSSASFKVRSTAGKIVNGTVRVNYFAKATDATPTSTKVVNVSVVDVNPATAIKSSLDIVAASEIDANGANLATIGHEINFGSAAIYVLDQNGNRINKVSPSSVTASTSDWAEVVGNELVFKNNAITTMTASNTVNVTVTADNITKVLPISLKNSAAVPHRATVNSAPIAVKLTGTDTSISIDDILYGVIDPDQLVIDNAPANTIIAVKNAASNGGYKYNKPVVNLTTAGNATLPIGFANYGILDTNTNGNFWASPSVLTQAGPFSTNQFVVDRSIANLTLSGNATFSGDTITVASGETATFTVVITGVRVSGDVKDDANLLASPVTINVTVTK